MKNLRPLIVLLAVAAAAWIVWWLLPESGTDPQGQDPVETPEDGPPERTRKPPSMLVLVGAVDDHLVREPCSHVPGGGVSSIPALVKLSQEFLPNTLTVVMGDVTSGTGYPGEWVVRYLLTRVLPGAGVNVLVAGPNEFAFGSGYVHRMFYAVPDMAVLCANAVDAAGTPVLKGWYLARTGDRTVLVVAVAGESCTDAMERSGTDIRLVSPAAAAEKALAAGRRAAEDRAMPPNSTVLLVQGTVDEARELLTAVPGFDMAAAGRGNLLADRQPDRSAGKPIYYAGRGARFAWRILLRDDEDGGIDAGLSRMGAELMARGTEMRPSLIRLREEVAGIGFELLGTEGDNRPAHPGGAYVGDSQCAECHAEIAAEHAASPHRNALLSLDGETSTGSYSCLSCHATGARWNGGWAGDHGGEDIDGVACENCHGPGAGHVAEPGAAYGQMEIRACLGCHLPDRDPTFDVQEAWDAWGHRAREE